MIPAAREQLLIQPPFFPFNFVPFSEERGKPDIVDTVWVLNTVQHRAPSLSGGVPAVTLSCFLRHLCDLLSDLREQVIS